MSKVVFFSFKEPDRSIVLTIKGRVLNSFYSILNFKVKDLLKRWKTEDTSVIRQAITKAMTGTSRTIVFVGTETYKSKWVMEEVKMTIENNKPVYAIHLKDTNGKIPDVLLRNGIHVYNWNEPRLQYLATA